MQYSKLVFALFLFTFQNQYAQFTDEINSNRPGKSMMAFAVGKKIIQAETGINYVTEKHDIQDYKTSGFIGELTGRYGVWKEELEVIAEIQYQNDKYSSNTINTGRSGFKHLELNT